MNSHIPVLQHEYETQLLEFHPRQFIDGMYNVFYENLFNALNQIKSYLCEEKKEVISSETIKQNTELMFQNLKQNLDKSFDKFEIFVCNNFLRIYDNVVLPEDKVHLTHSSTKEMELNIDQEIEELKQQIIKEKVRKSVLKEKKAEQKLVLEEMTFTQGKLKEVSNILRQSSITKEALNITAIKCSELCSFINEYGSQSGNLA